MLTKHKRTVIDALSLGFVLTLMSAQLPKMNHATAGSARFSEGLSLTKLDDLAAEQVPTDSVNGNTGCSDQQFTTRPEWRELLPPHTLLQPAIETDACVVQTAHGFADTRSANIQLFDSQQAGPLTAHAGSARVLPVPNNVMSLSFTSNGFVQVNQNTVSKLQPETNQLGHTVKCHLTWPPDFMLTGLAGQPQSNTMPIRAVTNPVPFSQPPPKSELLYNPQPTAQPQVLGAHSALPTAFSHPMNPVQPFLSYHSHPHNLWWLLVAIGFSTALIGAFYALWQHYRVKP